MPTRVAPPVACPGGLPGDGWTPPDKLRGTGTRQGTGADALVRLEGIDWTGQQRRGEIRAGAVVAIAADCLLMEGATTTGVFGDARWLVDVPGITRGGPVTEERPTGPLHLQNHGNPVRYHNVGVLPRP